MEDRRPGEIDIGLDNFIKQRKAFAILLSSASNILMKYLFFLLLTLPLITFSQDKDDSLSNGMSPKFYKKRNEAVLNVALVYYGDYYSQTDLQRVQKMFEDRVYEATNKMLRLNTVISTVIGFKHLIENYPDYRQDYVTDPERLQRLWYYDHVGAKILVEVYDEFKKRAPELNISLSQLDALVIITGAQFDALGFASGRVAVTENPMEIAWGLPDGGRVDYVSDAKVVDELIHELGHTLFLDHAASQCFKPGMDYYQSQACCANSPAKNDVMSYCRNRNLVNDLFFYKFEACNLRNIKNLIVPAMLSGGAWNVANREKCI